MTNTHPDAVILKPKGWWKRRDEHSTVKITARAIADAQWRIVDALQGLPQAAQELAIRQALAILDVADGYMTEDEQ